jgi:hypothetical protein
VSSNDDAGGRGGLQIPPSATSQVSNNVRRDGVAVNELLSYSRLAYMPSGLAKAGGKALLYAPAALHAAAHDLGCKRTWQDRTRNMLLCDGGS